MIGIAGWRWGGFSPTRFWLAGSRKEVDSHREAKCDHRVTNFFLIRFLSVVRAEPTAQQSTSDHYYAVRPQHSTRNHKGHYRRSVNHYGKKRSYGIDGMHVTHSQCSQHAQRQKADSGTEIPAINSHQQLEH